MRILHVLDHSLPLHSGYVFRTLGILGAQRGFGWETIHVTSSRHNAGAPASETVDGWTFNRTPKPRGGADRVPALREAVEMRNLGRRIDTMIREFRPDIIHAHSPVLTAIPALRAARRAGLPMVYEVRALWEDAAVDLGRIRAGGPRYRATRAVETWVLRRADAAVTLCAGMHAELSERGLPPGKVAVVPNAVDLAEFAAPQPKSPKLLQELGLTDRVVLGFIGSFYHYEGLDFLIAALAEIRRHVPNIALLLVGGGPEAEALQRQSAAQGVADIVRFTGRVPHAQVQAYYDLVDFLVYPRRKIRLTDLVTPLKPLEAMAGRRVVVASDVGGHRELIEDGVTGFLFTADDVGALARRIVEIIRTPGAHADIRDAGRKFVESARTWSASAAHYKPIYERLVRRPRTGVH